MDFLKLLYLLEFFVICNTATAQWCQKYQYVQKTRIQWNNGQRWITKQNFFGFIKHKLEPYVYSGIQHYTDYERVLVCCDGYKKYSESICNPICNPSCPTNSECVRPNVCECNNGYMGYSNTPSGINCTATCASPCPENASCVRPNECECNRDYRLTAAGLCAPTCTKKCPENSQCVAPNTCRCNEGYHDQSLNDSLECEPICTDGCPEYSVCSQPDKCSCIEGYKLGTTKDNSMRCVAHCVDDCTPHSFCSQPNLCECNEGYEKSSNGTCVPICESPCPEESWCTGPNNCTCIKGYKMHAAQCHPICDNPCPELAQCVKPNKCQCLDGYKLKLSDNQDIFCEPQCRQNCSTYGKCVQPNKCECLEGYEMDATETCQPVCSKGCSNGQCLRPEECVCNSGYHMNSQEICEPICSKPCENAICIEPEICQCSKGYAMKEDSVYACEPQCKPECINGLCVQPNVCKCHEGYEPMRTDEGVYHQHNCQEINASFSTTYSEELVTMQEITTTESDHSSHTDEVLETETTANYVPATSFATSTTAPLGSPDICTNRCSCWQEYDELGSLSTTPQCVPPCVDNYVRSCLNITLCKCDEVKTLLHCSADNEDYYSGEEGSLVYVCLQQKLQEYTQGETKKIIRKVEAHGTSWLWIALGSLVGACAVVAMMSLLYMKLKQQQVRAIEYEL